MLDFGILPPEVTSTQVYSGPGPGPLMVAASSWDALAAQVSSYTEGYSSAIDSLVGEYWAGPTAAAMAAAAAAYVQWAATTGVQAGEAAAQLRAAASAFEAAHAAITPPAAVAANRSQLANLIATNVLGQNAARIAATEAAYQGMWAQNSQAMYGYAASASSATKLSPFSEPPQTTNPAGQSAQAATAAASAATAGTSHTQALSQMIAAVPQQLSTASTPTGIPIPQSWVDAEEVIGKAMSANDSMFLVPARNIGSVGNSVFGWVRITTDGLFYAPLSAGLSSAGLTGATSPVTAGAATGSSAARAVLASVGESTTVGRLSTPQAWADVTPVATVNDQLSPLAKGGWGATPKVTVAGTGTAAAMAPMAQLAGAAAARKINRPSVSTILQVSPPRYAMPRPSSGG
ncbi:PPE family protein [Mycolicibacter sp. MYC340]|uniref:PPE family protein n=2 Tax=[Mycobacterium] nativiensis TaxID=2855503 RepID=A0ABU5XW48_9MYCO|nr:PPE family protein [Mycolicibacter sp. MYC340]